MFENTDDLFAEFRAHQEELALSKLNNDLEAREVKVAKLIILLNKIEEQLNIIETTLDKLIETRGVSTHIVSQAIGKKDKIEALRLTVQRARLNLNYNLL